MIYALTPSISNAKILKLTKLATYRTATNPLSLSIYPSTATSPATVAVADLMKSLSILTLTPPSTDNSEWALEEVARHFATLWCSAVTTVGENEWLIADMEGNMLVLRRNLTGVTAEDRRRLEVVSEGRLGEVVNTIVPVIVPAASPVASGTRDRAGSTNAAAQNGTSGPVISPRAFVATVEGGVYMMGTIGSAYQDTLMKLQSAVANRVQAPGYMPWTKFRAFKTEVREAEEPYRFVDGELVEQVLGFDDAVLEEVVAEVNEGVSQGMSVEECRVLVEGLRRLH